MKKINKKGLFAGITVLVVVVIGIGFFRKEEEPAETVLPSVETVQPEEGNIYLYTDLTGTVEPEDVVHIYPEASGTVSEIFIKAGDVVALGQPLCIIDTKQVESAQNAMETARLTMAEAQTELARQQTLYAGGGISQQEYETYVNAARRARLSYEKALLDYQNQISYSQVTAPIGGIVESCDMEVFDKVSQSSQLCVISGEGDKILSTGLTENLKDCVQMGDQIQAEKNGNFYSGNVYEISSMADSSSGLYRMKCRMEAEAPLSTGSVVKISFVSEKALGVLTVPVDAVYYESGSPYVFTFDEGTVHKKEIETGIYDSSQMEVRSGLNQEDQVILTWSPELYEGAKVQIKSQENRQEEMIFKKIFSEEVEGGVES